MKKLVTNRLLLMIVLIIGSSVSMYGQSHKTALSITGGYVDGGFGGLATLDYKVNEFDYLQFGLQGNFTKLEVSNIKVPVNLYSFNAGFFFDVLRNNKRTFALSLGAGGTVGSEVINNGDERLENGQTLEIEPSQIVFGAYAGLDADIFLIPTIAINIKAQEIYHFNSEIGELTPYFGIGVKLILK